MARSTCLAMCHSEEDTDPTIITSRCCRYDEIEQFNAQGLIVRV